MAVLRIAIAFAIYLVLRDLAGTWPANAPGAPEPPDVYRPVGIWMLFGGEPPSNWLIEQLWVVARISTFTMGVGLASRASTAISFGSSLLLASLYYSGFPTWSHAHNVVLLAHMALLGSRCGDTLSCDAIIRRLRKLPPKHTAGGYQWSVRLVQLAVAVMFASGMFHKVLQQGTLTLDWAVSDNLRHQLLIRFDLAGQERTAIANWIIDDAWRYRSAALANLVTQSVPLLACIFVHRPVIRAVCGLAFVTETLALGFVMDLWNLHWLPLAVVFVDWDFVLRAFSRDHTPTTAATPSWRPSLAIRTFVVSFVVYDLATAFVPRIDRRLNTYPFSGFPMFASIRARKPYSEHLPYAVAGGQFEVISREPVPDSVHRWLDHAYRRTFTVREREELRERLLSIIADARHWHPAIEGLRLHYTTFEMPAYPARAAVLPRRIAIIGEVDADGTFRSMLGSMHFDGQRPVLRPQDPEHSLAAIECYADDRAEPAVVLGGGASDLHACARRAAYVGVPVGADTRWLIATTPR